MKNHVRQMIYAYGKIWLLRYRLQIVGYLLEQLYFKISWLKFKPENPNALERGRGDIF